MPPKFQGLQIIQAQPWTELSWHAKADNNLLNNIATPSISNQHNS